MFSTVNRIEESCKTRIAWVFDRIWDRDDQDLMNFDRRNHASKCIIRFYLIAMIVDEKGYKDNSERVSDNEDKTKDDSEQDEIRETKSDREIYYVGIERS